MSERIGTAKNASFMRDFCRKFFHIKCQIDWLKPNEFGFIHTNPNWVSCLQFVLRFDKDLGCAHPRTMRLYKIHETV